MAAGETYEEFVKKFEPKKTTDDCYTPAVIMEAVNQWVADKYGLSRESFVRPFWPGGDYEHYDYPPDCVVVDNPPFSIVAKICQFYEQHGIRFFIFGPSLVSLNAVNKCETVCAIPCDVSVTYENGAVVNTGFLTNLEPGLYIKSEPELYKRLQAAEEENRRELTKSLPKYAYPNHIVTAAMVQKYTKYGVDFAVPREDASFIRALDSQRPHKKTVYGGGLLLSEKAAAEKAAAEKAAAEKAAAEKAAAEKAAAEKAAAHIWELSDRERAIVASLGRKEGAA